MIIQNKRKTWLLLIFLLIVFLTIGFFLSSPSKQEYPRYVSHSPSPTGVKAFYTYLKNEITDVERFRHTPEHLPTENKKHVLFMIQPYFVPKSEEIKYYYEFIENGNTIILFSTNPQGMFDLDTEWTNMFPSREGVTIYDYEGQAYSAIISTGLRLIESENDLPLLYDDYGIVALKRTIGEGELIVTINPDWLSNENILLHDHIPLITSLINENEPDIVLFDEYIHGSKSFTSTIYAYPEWFIVLFFLSIIVTIFYIWYKGKRFGPIFIPREDSVRFSDESIRALASWFMKGKLYHESLNIQAQFIRQRLQERWGINVKKPWIELENDFNQRQLQLDEDIPTFLSNLQRVLEKQSINKQEYLLWMKKLDQLRKEVENIARKTNRLVR